MVGKPVLFDTNILIDYLGSRPEARAEFDRRFDRAISVITWIEVMAGSIAADQEGTRNFLLQFAVLPLSTDVAERAFEIRRARRIKLPDAVIQATADLAGRLLITRNTRDFPKGTAGVHIPYQL